MTAKEKKLIGTTGVCDDCGREGIWGVNPYYEELFGIEEISCLCDDCLCRIASEI